MRIFFDVDLTILYSNQEGWELRPGTAEVFQRLTEMGHQIYVWTATGQPHAERVVRTFGLEQWVVQCMDKDPSSPVKPDMVVDDDQFLVGKYSGVWVEPYRQPDPTDSQLFRVLDALNGNGPHYFTPRQ